MFQAPSSPTITVTISLTERQKRWLRSRGGRTIEDVRIDAKGEPYVLMGNGYGQDVEVGIPSHQFLVQYDIDHYRGE